MKGVFETYRDKKIFITGHTGFKGSWLTALLLELGSNVRGYALAPETPSHFDMLNLASKIDHIEADVRDLNYLNESLHSFQPEIVFHLAAQPLVKKSYEDPVDTFSTNIMGGVNLLETVKNCPSVRSLVYITSDKCYENVEWEWGYREIDAIGGKDPYSASKGAAEVIFSSYLRSYFNANQKLGAASARAGNVIGGGDWAADRIVPDCIRAIKENRPISIRNPKATRPWQHVLEPLSGYLQLGALLYKDPKTYSGSWNFGPNTTEVRNVFEVAMAIVQNYGKGEIIVEEDPNTKHKEANLLQLCCDKAHQKMAWFPRWNVDKTLRMTSEWYKLVNNGENTEEVTRKQLKDYFPELS